MKAEDALEISKTFISNAVFCIKKGNNIKNYIFKSIEIVGSLRRGVDPVKDIDLLLVLPDDVELKFVEIRKNDHIKLEKIISSGDRFTSIIVKDKKKNTKIDIDLFRTDKKNYAFALFHFTGPKEYNIRIREHVKTRGYLLNQYGLFYRSSKKRVRGSEKIKTERSLAKFIGVSFKTPHDR